MKETNTPMWTRCECHSHGTTVVRAEKLAPIHAKQPLTYLRLMSLPVGLLINFGAPTFKEGFKRVVNNHRNFASSRLRVFA